jgi:purine-binding chemotaxis protein CheW
MTSQAQKGALSLLLCRAGSRVCGLPLANVIETMRPMPLEAIAGMPAFVVGLSVVRGAPTPVVDLPTLLGEDCQAPRARLIAVRIAERTVLLAAHAVLGIRTLDKSSIAASPPLLSHASAAFVSAIGTLDGQLLLILETGRLVPDALWAARAQSGQA